MLLLAAAALCHPTGLADPACTPGRFNRAVTQATIGSTVCRAGWTATVRPPASYTTELKRRQIAAWRLPGTTRDYEEDHLVPLELGGAPRSTRDLWPQPWRAARVKDRDENRLRRAVCSGALSLRAARRWMIRRWTKKGAA